MNELENKYQLVLEESKNNKDIIGLFLGGSRGKSSDFVTKNSDMDVYVVISDNALKELKDKLESYQSAEFEGRVFFLSEFIHYADWGSDREWDRYNFTHNKAIIDKTGEIQKLINEKGVLQESVRNKIIEDSLDSYINEVYRSVKYLRDNQTFASYLDATESLPFLMTVLYAFEGRLKPYNKYFEWELINYPLRLLPWKPDEFITDYKHILETGDIKTQEKIFKAIKKIATEQGFGKIIEGWKGKYFVGE